MKITLVDHPLRVILRSWSVWAGGFLPLIWLFLVEVLFAFFAIEITPAFAWVVAFALAALVPVLRIIKQRSLH